MRISKTNSVEVKIPEGTEALLENGVLRVRGPKGEASKDISDPVISVRIDAGNIILSAKRITQKEKKRIGTLVAHIKNLFKGVTKGVVYKLKICSEHFPMSVKVSGNQLIVTNFIGEKHPRVLELKHTDVKVEVNGNIIEVSGADKERVAQTAAAIEQRMRRTEYDRRIFQDGIYIIEKDGREIK